jgi:signal peptidase
MEISTKPRRPARFLRLLVNLFSLGTLLLAAGFIIPSAFGLQRYVITGTSMSGTYDLGSVVFEEVVPVNDLRVGDVITYMPPPESNIDHLVTHRIVKIKNGAYRTKGDAVPQVDPWTFRLDTVNQPRVKYSVPYVGYVFIALQDRTVRIALIGVPAGIIALISLIQLIGAIRPRRPQVRHAEGVSPSEPDSSTPVSASKPTVTVSG